MRAFLAAVAFAFAMTATTGPVAAQQSDPVVEYSDADVEMTAARDAARASYPQFMAAFRASSRAEQANNFLVKVGLDRSVGGLEHIWVDSLRLEGDTLVGALANEPQYLPGLHRGSPVTIDTARISDWAWVGPEGMYGNFTTRVMLDDIEPATAAQLRRVLTANPIPESWSR